MMNRRMFLRSLAGAAATVVAPKVYVFAPPGGWTLDRRVYTILGGQRGGGKSIQQYLTLAETERDLGPFLEARLEVLDPKLVRMLRTRRDEEWFL